jgi:hypothetical protein
MPRSKGKQKGSAFERKVCKALSLWVSSGEREDLFWRSAMSGGRATVGRKSGKDHARHAGDISATSIEGHALTDVWYVECKAYRNLQIDSALTKGVGKLIKFWDEAVAQADHYNKVPMLIAKQNQVPVLVLMPMAATWSNSGYEHFAKARVGTFYDLGCDVFDFERLLKVRFPYGKRRRERL